MEALARRCTRQGSPKANIKMTETGVATARVILKLFVVVLTIVS